MVNSEDYPGFFVVFEGPDGGGKTTQSQRLLAHLQELEYDVIRTREPGGTPLAELIRDVVLADLTYGHVSPRVEALLLTAARSQHVDDVIRPSLDAGKIVLCDRFKHSTIAYQGGGSGLNIDELMVLNQFATQGLDPDLVILLDVDSQIGLRRKIGLGDGRDGPTNKMELRGVEFHGRVRDQFKLMAKAAPDRWLVIDGEGSVDEISDTISQRVAEGIELKSIIPAQGATGRLL